MLRSYNPLELRQDSSIVRTEVLTFQESSSFLRPSEMIVVDISNIAKLDLQFIAKGIKFLALRLSRLPYYNVIRVST